jgi:hypothetical protein
MGQAGEYWLEKVTAPRNTSGTHRGCPMHEPYFAHLAPPAWQFNRIPYTTDFHEA